MLVGLENVSTGDRGGVMETSRSSSLSISASSVSSLHDSLDSE